MRISLLLVTCYLLPLTYAYALTDAWDVNVRENMAVQRTYKQGEAWDIAVNLRDGLKPLDTSNATALFLWYTNASGNVWWTNAAAVSASTVSFRWTPAMDCGAAVYPWWCGLWLPGSTSPLWRVSGTFRILPSPGFAPNTIQPPVQSIDFARIAVTNAPWLDAADAASLSNALAAALQSEAQARAGADAALSGRIDALPPPPDLSGYLPRTNAAGTASAGWDAGYDALRLEGGGIILGGGIRLTPAGIVNDMMYGELYPWPDIDSTLLPPDFDFMLATRGELSAAIDALPAPRPMDRIVTPAGDRWTDATGGVWAVSAAPAGDRVVLAFSAGFGFTPDWTDPPQYRPPQDQYILDRDVVTYDGGWQFLLLPKSWREWDVIATFEYSEHQSGYWECFLDGIPGEGAPSGGEGSMGWLVLLPHSETVTNHVGTVALDGDLAAATNALINAANAWLTVSNDVLTVWRVTNNITNIVWCSESVTGGGGGVPAAVTQELWSAVSTLSAQVAALSASKADRAWGKYAPDGSGNPDPDYMVLFNTPAVMHASGFTFAQRGAFSVLAQSGAVAFESGEGGEIRWGLDIVSNYVGFVRGGSVLVGADAESFAVTGAATPEGEAYITYAYGGGDFPVLMYSPSMALPFAEQAGVVWTDNLDGTATVTAPATTAGGFWYALTSAEFDAVFVAKPPARFDGGVVGATNALPVVYDATITITSGGATYRIPAQTTE